MSDFPLGNEPYRNVKYFPQNEKIPEPHEIPFLEPCEVGDLDA